MEINSSKRRTHTVDPENIAKAGKALKQAVRVIIIGTIGSVFVGATGMPPMYALIVSGLSVLLLLVLLYLTGAHLENSIFTILL